MGDERFRLLFENSPDAMVIADDSGKYLAVNPAACDLFGYSQDQMLRMHVHDLATAQAPHAAEQYENYLKSGREKGEFVFTRADGEARVASYSACRLTSGEHLSILHDITLQKQAEQALHSSETRFRMLVEQSLLSIQILRPDGFTIQVNRAWEQLWGLTLNDLREYNMLQDKQLVEQGIMPYIQRAFAGEAVAIPPVLYDTRQTIPDQEKKFHLQRWTQAYMYPVKDEAGRIRELVLIHQDITDQKHLEQQLLQAQKMEGIGKLAGGIAHDFNNLLTAIMGYTGLAESEIEADSVAYSHLQTVQQAAQRAAALTQQLLAFARKQVVEFQVFSLNDLILETDKLLRRVIGEDIELVTIPQPDLGFVKADPNQITQVLVNLAVNARDAMPEGGTLTIETHTVFLDENYARSHAEVQPGEYILLAVGDTGTGMTDEVKTRLFEPFFTTKEAGKGTGLGLATCYGIVKQHGGHIWVYSEAGQGTAFKIYLPAAQEPASALRQEAAALVPTGAETLLIVEDEPLVRSLAVEMLRAQGYTILEAGNGGEALDVVRNYEGRIHLLVTDVVMPQMGGKELALRLRESHPETKVLYVSGYTDNAIVHHGILDAGILFLQKPYTARALGRKVREALDAALDAEELP